MVATLVAIRTRHLTLYRALTLMTMPPSSIVKELELEPHWSPPEEDMTSPYTSPLLLLVASTSGTALPWAALARPPVQKPAARKRSAAQRGKKSAARRVPHALVGSMYTLLGAGRETGSQSLGTGTRSEGTGALSYVPGHSELQNEIEVSIPGLPVFCLSPN